MIQTIMTTATCPCSRVLALEVGTRRTCPDCHAVHDSTDLGNGWVRVVTTRGVATVDRDQPVEGGGRG